MSLPLERPSRAAPRRRRSVAGLWWVLLVISLAAVLGLGFRYGYNLALSGRPYQIWDPIVMRAYRDRPFDLSLPGGGFWVAAYHVDYDRDSYDTLVQRVPTLDQVVATGYGFNRDGTVVGAEEEIFRMRGVTSAAKRVLMFANLTDGQFDRETAHAILTDPEAQERAIAGMVAKSQALEVSGIQIDFEYVPSGDRQALSGFMARLGAICKENGWTLSMAVPVKLRDDPSNDWSGAFDYPALGAVVDQLYLMAYDEHWSGGPPGPVASLPFTQKVIQYAVGVVPAQKLVLGVPFYGYEWPVGGERARAFGGSSMARRMEQNGAEVKWDPIQGENLGRYQAEDGTERIAWYPDLRSLEAKIDLAKTYNMKGIVAWRLGFEPDEWWEPLSRATSGNAAFR